MLFLVAQNMVLSFLKMEYMVVFLISCRVILLHRTFGIPDYSDNLKPKAPKTFVNIFRSRSFNIMTKGFHIHLQDDFFCRYDPNRYCFCCPTIHGRSIMCICKGQIVEKMLLIVPYTDARKYQTELVGLKMVIFRKYCSMHPVFL